jgi:hypothetical protein
MYTVPPLSSVQPSKPQAFVDTPNVVYTEWPRNCGGIDAPLGRLDKKFRICVVGGGLTGCQVSSLARRPLTFRLLLNSQRQALK